MHWSRKINQAICIGGVFATSEVLPGKIQHLVFHLESIDRFGTDGIPEHLLSIAGLFILLSVLTWIEERQERPTRLLTAYPPQSETVVSAHIAGLIAGAFLLFSTRH